MTTEARWHGQIWPVIGGIPYLRLGREALAAAAHQAQALGDREAALALLLADQDDCWTSETAPVDDLRALARDSHRMTLREAMAALRWGRVADYFAHRCSDPTFLGRNMGRVVLTRASSIEAAEPPISLRTTPRNWRLRGSSAKSMACA